MSGLYYTNPAVNPYMPQNYQYGVDSGSSGTSAGLQAASGIASFIPYIGPFVSAALNLAGTAYQNYKQEEFYNKYQSPQARMSQMMSAGINPNAAAQGISGSAPPAMSAAPMSSAGNAIGELLGNSVNTALTADNIRADIENKKANTENVEIQNRFENATFDDRAALVYNDLLISYEDYKQAVTLTKNYPEILNQSIEETKSNIRKNDKQIEVYDQQIKNLEKEIDKMEAEIKKIKADETLAYAEVGETQARQQLEIAETNLTNKKTELAAIEKKKADLGADSNVELKYRDIRKKYGQKSADKWLDTQYNIVNKVEQAVQDANVMTQEQRRIIASYDRQIEQAEAYLEECTRKYYNASTTTGRSWHKGAMDQARNSLDNLRKQKAEQLRRLNSNTYESVKIFGVGGSRTR